MKEFLKKNWLKLLLTVGCIVLDYFIGVIGLLYLAWGLGANDVLAFGAFLVFPALFLPLVWCKKNKWKKCFIGWVVFMAVYAVILAIPFAIEAYEDSITVKEVVNIDTSEYMPFDENSKIALLDAESTLKLTDNLPIVDGAAAFFPVYSAYVNAVYPSDTVLTAYHENGNNPFQYNNTYMGYWLLGERKTDIFFGVYPSEEQIE